MLGFVDSFGCCTKFEVPSLFQRWEVLNFRGYLLPVCIQCCFAVCVAANVWINRVGVDAVELYMHDGVYVHKDSFMLAIFATEVFAAVWTVDLYDV